MRTQIVPLSVPLALRAAANWHFLLLPAPRLQTRSIVASPRIIHSNYKKENLMSRSLLDHLHCPGCGPLYPANTRPAASAASPMPYTSPTWITPMPTPPCPYAALSRTLKTAETSTPVTLSKLQTPARAGLQSMTSSATVPAPKSMLCSRRLSPFSARAIDSNQGMKLTFTDMTTWASANASLSAAARQPPGTGMSLKRRPAARQRTAKPRRGQRRFARSRGATIKYLETLK